MFSLFSLVARALFPAASSKAQTPAAALMEAADSRAGFDPANARELRAAAAAWLSVVR